ncbi:hypothetical protein B6U83_02590 [Thermoplasmatales archaeon ex4484_36]|nr:MAG: hypothetical protein B6U83_02590 [Thermoplasmatales archaeon ex4484_36]
MELSFEEFSELFRDIPGVTRQTLKTLYENGINTVEKIAGSAVEDLSRFRGIGEKTALRSRRRSLWKSRGWARTWPQR